MNFFTLIFNNLNPKEKLEFEIFRRELWKKQKSEELNNLIQSKIDCRSGNYKSSETFWQKLRSI